MSGYSSRARMHRHFRNYNKARKQAAKKDLRARLLTPTKKSTEGKTMTFAIGFALGLTLGAIAAFLFVGLVK